jgi:PAS domain S-box-containing protein
MSVDGMDDGRTPSVFEVLRRQEAGLRLALDAGQMGSFEWDIRTGEIRWSENLERIHGMPAGTFGGTFESFKTLIHPEDRERVVAAIWRSVETRADYETEFRSADTAHGVRWLMGKGKVVADEGGEAGLMIGVCIDITKQKLAESELLAANRRKDEFLAMVSHELRNPLAAILNASALLEHGGGSPGNPIVGQAAATIRRQSAQLVRIVDDLLDVSRLQAGKLSLASAPLDLASVVESCVRDFVARGLFARHSHEVRCQVAPVSGDAARLGQVVSNLLTNAIKYTPAGGHVAIDVRSAGGHAVLTVKDTGVGIAADLLPRIFDLFVQSDRGLDRPEGGLGLGLTIVRSIVTAHGGHVEALSGGPGAGTEVVVHLPLAAGPAGAGDAAAAAARPSTRQRILLVDDNDDARESISALLRIAGHEIHQAREPLEGLALAARAPLDLAILDVGLPGFDGFELGRRLKERNPSLRLIALTGYGQADYRRRGAEVGFEAYLVKPADLELLLDKIAGAPRRA